MFWMNKEDADALLEDTVRLCQHRMLNADVYYGPSAESLRAEEPIYQERSRNIRLILQEQKRWSITNKAHKKLRRMNCQNFHLIGCFLAGTAALEPTMKALSVLTGETPEAIQDFAQGLMRKAYDKVIDKCLGNGALLLDPRNEGAIWAHPVRSWYASLQSRSGKAPSDEPDKEFLNRKNTLIERAEVSLKEVAVRQYGPSEAAQRQQRLDVALAESIRITAKILRYEVMHAEALARQTLAQHRFHDFEACVVATTVAATDLLNKLAKFARQPRPVVQEPIYLLMRRSYDAYIDKALADKQVLDDPRKIGDFWLPFMRDWYFPAEST
jgi:hypothetical protein